MSVTIVGFPISASLGVVSTVSTCVGACLLLTSKKYKKKLLKCYELLDKITTPLASFETLISLSIDDNSAIDAKEFHKLQTLYLQLMTHVRNVDRKMKVQTEENFQNTIMDEIINLKKALEQKQLVAVYVFYLIAYIEGWIRSSNKFTILMVDTGEVKVRSRDWQKHQAQRKNKQRNGY